MILKSSLCFYNCLAFLQHRISLLDPRYLSFLLCLYIRSLKLQVIISSRNLICKTGKAWACFVRKMLFSVLLSCHHLKEKKESFLLFSVWDGGESHFCWCFMYGFPLCFHFLWWLALALKPTGLTYSGDNSILKLPVPWQWFSNSVLKSPSNTLFPSTAMGITILSKHS